MRGTCENCRFMESTSEEKGECRKNPPTSFLLVAQSISGPQPAIIAGFPTVSNATWCGAHSFKPLPDAPDRFQ